MDILDRETLPVFCLSISVRQMPLRVDGGEEMSSDNGRF